jgi:hypothetical protein
MAKKNQNALQKQRIGENCHNALIYDPTSFACAVAAGRIHFGGFRPMPLH